jgi:ABC-type uncharacterized transport system permease subunit
MQRDAGVPSSLVSMIEALLILAIVAAQAFRLRRVRAPRIAATTSSA